jgi:hypothetical protein
MVRHAREYRWSSYRAHAEGAADDLLSEHAIWRGLQSRTGVRVDFRGDRDRRARQGYRRGRGGPGPAGGGGFDEHGPVT